MMQYFDMDELQTLDMFRSDSVEECLEGLRDAAQDFYKDETLTELLTGIIDKLEHMSDSEYLQIDYTEAFEDLDYDQDEYFDTGTITEDYESSVSPVDFMWGMPHNAISIDFLV